MTSNNWQLVAVAACVVWAVFVIARRGMRLFGESESKVCGPGGCSTCPSNQSVESSARRNDGFVPLQTLVETSRSVTRSPKP